MSYIFLLFLRSFYVVTFVVDGLDAKTKFDKNHFMVVKLYVVSVYNIKEIDDICC